MKVLSVLSVICCLFGVAVAQDYICKICGESQMSTNPGGIIDLGDGSTTCAAVYQVAQASGFNETFCLETVQPTVKEPCGCVDTLAPSTAPSLDPSGAPSGEIGASTDAPTPAPAAAAAVSMQAGIWTTITAALVLEALY
jgi:hypothetical protein